MAPRIVIVEYDPAWPRAFEAERARLAEVLCPYALTLEHIGATAVPGLAAKPTIDIAVGLARLADAPPCTLRMARLGYDYRPELEAEMPERRFFRKGYTEGAQATHQVHMTEVGSDFFDRDLLFRDWLRGHPEDRAAYAALKRELAARHGDDRDAYTRAKADFIRALQAKAAEARAQASDLRTRRGAAAAPPLAPPGAPRPPS